jgi:hypothetical protein
LLEGRRSIQLSYGRSLPNFSYYKHLRYNLLCLSNPVHPKNLREG